MIRQQVVALEEGDRARMEAFLKAIQISTIEEAIPITPISRPPISKIVKGE